MRGDVHVRFGGRAEETDHADEAGTAPRPDPYTYIRTWEGWAYLAVVLDVHTRRIVGWQLASHMRQSLVSDAFEMALSARLEHADGLVAHSDNGAQGGFKGSSQHRLPEPSVAVRRALLPAFSSRESCAVDC
jgi:putative transposase